MSKEVGTKNTVKRVKQGDKTITLNLPSKEKPKIKQSVTVENIDDLIVSDDYVLETVEEVERNEPEDTLVKDNGKYTLDPGNSILDVIKFTVNQLGKGYTIKDICMKIGVEFNIPTTKMEEIASRCKSSDALLSEVISLWA